MLQRRRNASISGLIFVVGSILIAWSTFLPAVALSGPDLNFGHVGIGTSADITLGDSQTGLLIRVCSMVTVIAGLSLMIVRRRGIGVVWRLVGLTSLIPAVVVAIGLSYGLSHPDAFMADSSLPLMTRVFAGMAVFHVTEVDPRSGLWFLVGGSVLVIIGVMIPALRSQRFVIDGSDPRFGRLITGF